MLTSEQMQSNKVKFIQTNSKYNILPPELEDFLGEDFYHAPATTTLDMYGAYPGGLLNHCLQASKYAIKLNNILPEKMQQSVDSILKCVFLSQIGKTFMFKFNESEWHRKTLGKMYDFVEHEVSMKSGERSIYYLMKYGVTLKEDEFQTIINSEKDSDDKMSKYRLTDLSNIVRMGIELSILEEKNGQKGN
jgi:hypothetical protein